MRLLLSFSLLMLVASGCDSRPVYPLDDEDAGRIMDASGTDGSADASRQPDAEQSETGAPTDGGTPEAGDAGDGGG